MIGAPYVVAGTTYTPADVMNYDEVGYASAGTGQGATAAHHTLPVPSYVEVTSLESGRTVLVRVESRGPMDSTHLISLSPAAMAQLEASDGEAVRVRRVNPPEEQRAMLRGDQLAPMRMDTPTGLVEVLRRRLPAEGSASLRAEAAPAPRKKLAIAPQPATLPALAPLGASQEDESFEQAFAEAPEATPEPARAPQAVTPDGDGNFVVQAGAYSTAERAQRVASTISGNVSQTGSLYRVRTGPFATRAQAEASLANVQAAGYSDARIYPVG